MSTSAQSHKDAKKKRGNIKKAKALAKAEDLRDKEANPEVREKSSLLGKRQPESGIDTPPSHRRRGEDEPTFSPPSSVHESKGESGNKEREENALESVCPSFKDEYPSPDDSQPPQAPPTVGLVKSSSQHQLPQQLVFANQDNAIQQIFEVLTEQAVATWIHRAQAKYTANPQWDVYAYLASHIIYALDVQFFQDGQQRDGEVWRAFLRPKLYKEAGVQGPGKSKKFEGGFASPNP
jgi:hypothetical protein